jgi:hypothetical protein
LTAETSSDSEIFKLRALRISPLVVFLERLPELRDKSFDYWILFFALLELRVQRFFFCFFSFVSPLS